MLAVFMVVGEGARLNILFLDARRFFLFLFLIVPFWGGFDMHTRRMYRMYTAYACT